MKKEKRGGNGMKWVVISGIVLIVLVAGFYIILNNISNSYSGLSIYQNKDAELEKCMQNQDLNVYVSSNLDEFAVKSNIAGYLHYFKIFDCAQNNALCTENMISENVVFIINNQRISGDIDEQQLKQLTGC